MQKKTDINAIVGFILMGVILVWYIYTNDSHLPSQMNKDNSSIIVEKRSNSIENLPKEKVFLPKNSTFEEKITVLENDLVKIKISSKGGQIIQAQLKKYTTFDLLPLYLVDKGNHKFNIKFTNIQGQNINTSELFFHPTLKQIQGREVLSMKSVISEGKSIEYLYTLPLDDYMLDFSIHTMGMSDYINANENIKLYWNMKTVNHEKSKTYENRYTEMYYNKDNGKIDYLSVGGIDEESEDKNIKWVAYKQHFFSSVLVTDKRFKTALLRSESIDDESIFTKSFSSVLSLEIKNGELNYDMNLYYGPNDLGVLDKYEHQLEELVPLGWGIFGVVNEYFIYPIFRLFHSMGLSVGLAILFLTFVVKTLLFPITYKNFLSTAKMRVIRPEINELNKKLEKADPMKKQQATMELYRKAGVNPMAGCLPMLLQMPILFAMFRFFPIAIELRQQPFLWATDLSSYDSIYDFGFYIPLYGDHISLFALLMSLSTLLYTKMSGNAGMAQPSQPGMPNMKVIMYIMPVMMIFFFNDFASGLSYYYLMANLINIVQIVIIKKYIIDEDKIHAQMQENKKRPHKKSRFQAKLAEMAKKAQEQRQQR